jgi:predicted DNA-binding transcriptional regulator YafY
MMLHLHVHGRTTAAALARDLEVSERTIYRDIDALSTAGVPVYATSGPNGGLMLDEQYRVSLNGFSPAELRALFVSNDATPLQDLGLGRSTLLLKLFAALPTAQRGEVERLRQRLHIDSANWFQVVEPLPWLALLQQAVWEDQCLEVSYQPVEGEQSGRVLEAYGLVAKANIWYLVAKKPGALLSEMRYYRANRFMDVTLSGQRFDRDPAFDLTTYWREAVARYEEQMLKDNPLYEVLLRVHQEAFWYFPATMEGVYDRTTPVDADGWHTLKVRFPSLSEATRRIIGFGTKIVVLEPAELRESIAALGRAVWEGNKDTLF